MHGGRTLLQHCSLCITLRMMLQAHTVKTYSGAWNENMKLQHKAMLSNAPHLLPPGDTGLPDLPLDKLLQQKQRLQNKPRTCIFIASRQPEQPCSYTALVHLEQRLTSQNAQRYAGCTERQCSC